MNPGSLLESFVASARAHPQAVAVVDGEASLTRAALDQDSSLLARGLSALGSHSGPVAVDVPKSLDFFSLFFACLKAGRTLLPVSGGWPAERRAQLLEAAGVGLVVSPTPERWAGPGRTVVGVEALRKRAAGAPLAKGGSELAYLLFTSGSTGNPKGVQIPTRALDAFFRNIVEFVPMAPLGERLGCLSEATFDMWVMDVSFMAAGRGPLHLLRPTLVGLELVQSIARQQLTYLSAVPSVCSLLVGYRRWIQPADLASLRHLCLGGATLHPHVVASMQQLAPGAQLYNLFGPTEATGCCAGLRVDPARDLTGPSVHVGAPFSDQRFLFEAGGVVRDSPGEEAELLISGTQLMAGYLGPHPGLETVPHQGRALTVYRSGDLFTDRPDGRLRFLARKGGFVKSGGFRISPDEVEAAYVRCPQLEECAVVAVPHPTRENILVLFYSASAPVEPAALGEFGRGQLPDYCLPQAFVQVEGLPRTSSGKIDRRRLSERYREQGALHG